LTPRRPAAESRFGPGAAFWLSLQSPYDLAMAEKRLGAKIRAAVEAA
jgi:plasmid maintenance system antidote protein VapI